jgi:hypothetical protein
VGRSSVRRYVAARREGKPLSSKGRPGSKLELDERARRLLEVDVGEKPTITLKEILFTLLLSSDGVFED